MHPAMLKLNSRTLQKRDLAGFTLLEVIIVVAILLIVAGIAVFRGAATVESAYQTVTATNLREIQNAILGKLGAPGFRDDVGEIPGMIEDLLTIPQFTMTGVAVAPFDPSTGRGWNGPYISNSTGIYNMNGAGFTSDYGRNGGRAILDPWRRPIILQIPTTPGLAHHDRIQYSRLVSAGPNGIIDTPPGMQAPDVTNPAHVDDDLILYLFRVNGP